MRLHRAPADDPSRRPGSRRARARRAWSRAPPGPSRFSGRRAARRSRRRSPRARSGRFASPHRSSAAPLADDVEAVAGVARTDHDLAGVRRRPGRDARRFAPSRRGKAARRARRPRSAQAPSQARPRSRSRRSRRCVRRTRIGRTAPTTMNVGRSPIRLRIAGVTNEPTATAPIARPQVTPSTRVSTSSGTVRWSSVNPATSTTLFAAPIAASRSTTGASVRQRRDQHDRDAPEDEPPRKGRRKPLAAKRHGAERADQASGPDRGGEVSDDGRTPVEHLVGGHDEQDVQAPADERLRGDQAHEEPRARNLFDRLQALPDLEPRPTRRYWDATPDRHPGQEQRLRRAACRRRPRRPRRHRRRRPADRHRAGRAGCRGSRSWRSLRSPRSAPSPFAPATEAARRERAGTASSRRRPQPRRRRRRCDRRARLPRPRRRDAAAPSSAIPSRNRSRRKRSPKDDAKGAMTAAGSRRTRPATPTAVEPPWS